MEKSSGIAFLIEKYINIWAPYDNAGDYFYLTYSVRNKEIIISQRGLCCGDQSSIPIIKIKFDKNKSTWRLFWFNVDHWVNYDKTRTYTLEEALIAVDEDDSSYFFG